MAEPYVRPDVRQFLDYLNALPGPAGEIGLRLFDARETREPGALFLFFHGGGFAGRQIVGGGRHESFFATDASPPFKRVARVVPPP